MNSVQVDDAPGMKIFEETASNQYAVAKHLITTGSVIATLSGDSYQTPNKFTIQAGIASHVLNRGKLVKMNHSCDPNCYFKWSSSRQDQPELFALRDIRKDEAICFNYTSTEWQLASPFNCECGVSSCYGKISGFSALNERQRDSISSIVAPHILQISYSVENHWKIAPSSIAGSGVFAKKSFCLGEAISLLPVSFTEFNSVKTFESKLSSHSQEESRQLLQHAHPEFGGRVVVFDKSSPESFLNHSEEPNARSKCNITNSFAAGERGKYTAERAIQKGHEICIDFNLEFGYGTRTDETMRAYQRIIKQHSVVKDPHNREN